MAVGNGIQLGVTLRIMGEASRPATLLSCAREAEATGLDALWVADHLAIPPDEAEGSDGRYLDPLTALAWLASATEQIQLATGVINLPYRPPLPTAKAIATVQELSSGRLVLGVGVGWMQAEFRALGVDRRRRGALTDETLRFLHACFDAVGDRVEANGQPFLFRPRPARPPIFVGGSAPHALERTVRYGDGWLPMAPKPEALGPEIAQLHELAEAAGRPRPEVATFGGLPPDPAAAAERLQRLGELGYTRFAVGTRYASADEFRRVLEPLAAVREALGT